MSIVYYPLSSMTDQPTLFSTMPLNTVVCCRESPVVKLYVPSRLTSANYYDTLVHKVSIPASTAFPVDAVNIFNLSDVIAVGMETDPTTVNADHDCILLNYTDGLTVNIYNGVAGAPWQLLMEAVVLTIASTYEERVLPTCITSPGLIAKELTIDCRSQTTPIEGLALRTAVDTLRIPVVVTPGTVYGDLVVPSTVVDLDTIERVFLTDTNVEDLFPMSPTGNYLTIIQVMISSVPHAILMYGANQSLQSQAIELVNVTAETYISAQEDAFGGLALDTTLSVTGGMSELQQYDLFSHVLYPSKTVPYIDIDFTVTDVSAPVDQNAYLAIGLHHDTGITHIAHPGCPTSPDGVTVILNLRATSLQVVNTSDVVINTGSLGGGYDGDDVEGNWKLRIVRGEVSSLLYIYQNNGLMDTVTIPFTRQTLLKPLTVTWYMNGAGDVCEVSVVDITSTNEAPFPTTVDMCVGAATATTLTPCMDTVDILAEIAYTSYVDFETEAVGWLANGAAITADVVSDIDWTIVNSTQPAQIAAPGLISGSDQYLYLPAKTTLEASTSASTLVSSMSVKAIVRLTDASSTNVIVVDYQPVNPAENIRTVEVRANGADGWYLNHTFTPADPTYIKQTVDGKLNTPAVLPNVTYCLTMVLSATEMTLYVNGVKYSKSNIGLFLPLFTPLTTQGEVPGTTLKVVLGADSDSYLDDVVLGWNEAWSSLVATALNNAPETRSPLIDCNWANLVTDISKQPVQLSPVPSNYGGVVKSSMVNSYFLFANTATQVFSIPPQFVYAVVDVVLTSKVSGTAKIMFGTNATQVLETIAVNNNSSIVRAIRLSRGTTLSVDTDVDVAVRITALLG